MAVHWQCWIPDKVALLTGKPSAPAQEKTRVGERSRYCQHFAGRSGYREPVGDSRHTRDEPQASGCRSLEPTNGYGRQNCLRDVVEGSVRPLGPPLHDYDNTGRASTRRLRTRRSIRQRSLLFLFLLLRHPVADAGIGEDVGAVVLVAAEAADGGAHRLPPSTPRVPHLLQRLDECPRLLHGPLFPL